MKQILTALLLFVGVSLNAQIAELRISPNLVSTDINGGSIEKDDTVQVALILKNNGSNIRNFYLDFQHQISAINMIGVVFPQSGTEALPQGTQTSFTNNYYPGYFWLDNVNNNSENGLQNAQNASYGYSQGENKAINRININTATPNGNATQLNDGVLCYLRFKVVNVAAGFAYDSIYYNFAYGWNNLGQQMSVRMPKPNSAWVNINPSSNALIEGNFQINSNLAQNLQPTLYIVDSATSTIKATRVVSSNGNFTLTSELLPNTVYYAIASVPSQAYADVLTKAITISDYTAAQNEFIKQNLDGSFNKISMTSGMSFFASDVNQNQTFDGGDLALLFAQAVGADTIFVPQANSNTTNLPIFLASYYDQVDINNALQQTSIGLNSFKVRFKTKDVVDTIKLKYIVPGDINRSHSSQVTVAGQNVTTSANKIIVSGLSNRAYNFPNTTNDIKYIDINLNNLTVTSNTIEIPIKMDARDNKLSGVQFEVVFDPTKVKFEEIKSDVPSSWYVFATSKEGKLRFGALSKDLKTTVSGASVPFKLKFSAIESGLDLNTKIRITSNLDASDENGKQLGINLNTETIKLTGYNNFN